MKIVLIPERLAADHYKFKMMSGKVYEILPGVITDEMTVLEALEKLNELYPDEGLIPRHSEAAKSAMKEGGALYGTVLCGPPGGGDWPSDRTLGSSYAGD
eukprot:TRINITY_DN26289_c0_g1_i1.p1 TRINITY_DN26289_c0_g1~~TRINITY_DN26289_c0_g1_i1.p1  ORF type:complete len:100 (-),score=13.58 TRINITY_DN26289_c0_g1_i1:337-636(-)